MCTSIAVVEITFSFIMKKWKGDKSMGTFLYLLLIKFVINQIKINWL